MTIDLNYREQAMVEVFRKLDDYHRGVAWQQLVILSKEPPFRRSRDAAATGRPKVEAGQSAKVIQLFPAQE